MFYSHIQKNARKIWLQLIENSQHLNAKRRYGKNGGKALLHYCKSGLAGIFRHDGSGHSRPVLSSLSKYASVLFLSLASSGIIHGQRISVGSPSQTRGFLVFLSEPP